MTPEARVERLRVERLRVECVGKQVARVPLPVASAELATRSDDSKVSANSPELPITTLRHKKYPRIRAQNQDAPARPLTHPVYRSHLLKMKRDASAWKTSVPSPPWYEK